MRLQQWFAIFSAALMSSPGQRAVMACAWSGVVMMVLGTWNTIQLHLAYIISYFTSTLEDDSFIDLEAGYIPRTISDDLCSPRDQLGRTGAPQAGRAPGRNRDAKQGLDTHRRRACVMKMLHHLPSVKRLPKDFYKAYGLTRIPIHGDGNCFFRAVSLSVFGTQAFHMRLRQLTTASFQDDSGALQFAVNHEHLVAGWDCLVWLHYYRRMYSRKGVWADDLCVGVLARALGVVIHILKDESGHVDRYQRVLTVTDDQLCHMTDREQKALIGSSAHVVLLLRDGHYEVLACPEDL